MLCVHFLRMPDLWEEEEGHGTGSVNSNNVFLLEIMVLKGLVEGLDADLDEYPLSLYRRKGSKVRR